MKLNQLRIFAIALLVLIIGVRCNTTKPEESTEVKDFADYYDEFAVEGCFLLFDQNANKWIAYNQEMAKQAYTPASTFKICNSIIGLETGVIKDTGFVIPWDGVKRNAVWDQDHTLAGAYQHSTVWYYQELARRVGQKRMNKMLKTLNYGNNNTEGGIDKFWLTGGLRVTPYEQIDFLRRLHEGELSCSESTLQQVKEIMVQPDLKRMKVHAKTGWGVDDNHDIGWFVGYVEKGDNVYYFANLVVKSTEQLEDMKALQDFDASRKQVVLNILADLRIYE